MLFEIEKLEEKINILQDGLRKQKEQVSSRNLRIERYGSLKALVEKMNHKFELEVVADNLLESVFELVAGGKGNCVLYLLDTHNQRLTLFATKKENPHLVIKAKEGDIFDYWVLKHSSSLLVEDVKKDFRFDLEKIEKEYVRPIRSLISSPLMSQQRLLGVIRLDSDASMAYNQDDLRFLDIISDLASVALENAKLFKETQELAIKDSLTNCYTRGYFLERLKEEFKRSVRRLQPLSLFMIDIDDFKKYNDKFGHIAGDIVLQEIGLIMTEFSKVHNLIISRFGGEEFSVLLPNTDKKQALELAEKLRTLIQDKIIVLRQKKTSITVSIGEAAYPNDGSDEDELMRKSDIALYKAKQKGKNRVCGI
jgi:diguanylate cyclase (GGDEF)-like protein